MRVIVVYFSYRLDCQSGLGTMEVCICLYCVVCVFCMCVSAMFVLFLSLSLSCAALAGIYVVWIGKFSFNSPKLVLVLQKKIHVGLIIYKACRTHVAYCCY